MTLHRPSSRNEHRLCACAVSAVKRELPDIVALVLGQSQDVVNSFRNLPGTALVEVGARCNDLVKRRYKLGAMTSLRRADDTEMTGCACDRGRSHARYPCSDRRLVRTAPGQRSCCWPGPVWRRMRRKSASRPRSASSRRPRSKCPSRRPGSSSRRSPTRRPRSKTPRRPARPARTRRGPRPVPRASPIRLARMRAAEAPTAAETPQPPPGKQARARPTPRQSPPCDSRWRARRRTLGRSTTRDSRTT